MEKLQLSSETSTLAKEGIQGSADSGKDHTLTVILPTITETTRM